MEFLSFLLQTILVSLSGVMSPGPITAAAIAQGTRQSRAGALIAVGHGIVEFPLMIALALGLGVAAGVKWVESSLFIAGGAILLFMAYGMARSAHRPTQAAIKHGPLGTGIAFSAANPYFLVWWVTVGAALIARSLHFGLWAFAVFGVVHWCCDLGWYSALSAASSKGRKWLGPQFQRIVWTVCGIFLTVFGLTFLFNGIRKLI